MSIMTILAPWGQPRSRSVRLSAVLTALPGRIITERGTFLHAWRRRRQYRTLLDFDDRMLDDMGVTREEVYRHAGLPLYRNAAIELSHAAWTRRNRRTR